MAMNVVSTAGTCLIAAIVLNAMGGSAVLSSSPKLITMLGVLSFFQFIFGSFLASVYMSLKEKESIFERWKRTYLTSSLSSVVGAGLAGLIFKLINYGDVVTAIVTGVVLLLMFVTYRQSIADINTAFEKAQEAERQKADAQQERADAEKRRRQEAENYAQELSKLLEKEARSNAALRKSEKIFNTPLFMIPLPAFLTVNFWEISCRR